MTTHSAENVCLRSMLVTTIGISTRNRVLRLVVFGVDISIYEGLTLVGTELTPQFDRIRPEPRAKKNRVR
jgi:hypothetical protein